MTAAGPAVTALERLATALGTREFCGLPVPERDQEPGWHAVSDVRARCCEQ